VISVEFLTAVDITRRSLETSPNGAGAQRGRISADMVAKGDSLAEILDSLCLLVEEQSSDALASILLWIQMASNCDMAQHPPSESAHRSD
jgi:hypothetical protein